MRRPSARLIPGIALCLLYILLNSYKITWPGLHYDETFFVGAAKGQTEGMFVHSSLSGIPLLLMPYIGALKAWVYFPIFKLFGVSVESIRLPSILIAAVGLFYLYQALQTIVGWRTSALALFILIVNPVFLMATRMEVGPVTFEFTLVCLSLFLFFQFLNARKLRFLILLTTTLWLGMFNKLTFIWFLNSFVVGAAICYAREIIHAAKKALISPKLGSGLAAATILSLLSYFFLMVPTTHYPNTNSYLLQSNWSFRLGYTLTALRDLISGFSYYQYAIGSGQHVLDRAFPVFMVLLICFSVVAAIRNWRATRIDQKTHCFFLFLLLGVTAQIVITRVAAAPWHFFSCYIFFSVVIALAVQSLVKFFNRRALGRVLAAAIGAYYASVTVLHVNSMSLSPRDSGWSQAIYELANYCGQIDSKCVTLDWGIYNQLAGLLNDQKAPMEFIPMPRPWSNDYLQRLLGYPRYPANFVYVAFPDDAVVGPKGKTILFEEAEKSGFNFKRIKTISDRGRLVYEIFRLSYDSGGRTPLYPNSAPN